MRTRYYHRLLTLAAMSTSVLLSQCSSPPPSGSEPLGRARQAIECVDNDDCHNGCLVGEYCVDGSCEGGYPLPPQDACWDNAVDPGVPTSLYDATTFLWNGTGRVQRDVWADIDPKRVAVIRGQVRDRAGAAMSGVTVTVVGHNEYGSTQTLGTEGWFDMVVNGGGELVVRFEKSGYLPVERKVRAPWKDYVIAADVAMTPVPSQIGTFTCGPGWQEAHTGQVDGRRITILFPPSTCVDGYSTGDIFSVRAVEYTTGSAGGNPASMPSELPPASGFTFAAELQLFHGSTQVSPTFTGLPVITFVDNFLDLPVGEQVPSGYYDNDLSAWVQNTDGSQPLNGAVVTVGSLSQEERTILLNLGVGYDANTELWRVPLRHFSQVDYNLPVAPKGATGPDGVAPPAGDKSQDKPSCTQGSIIACENQVLGERLPLAGTPFDLVYRSDRVPGYKAVRQLRIPLIATSFPQDLRRIDLQVIVAGRRTDDSLSTCSQPPCAYDFTWDGLDAYNRMLNGAQPVTVKLGYVYDAVYSAGQGFANPGGAALEFNPARQQFTYWREWKGTIGGWDATGFGLGGWSIDQLHAYSPATHTLYLGDGSRRTAATMAETIASIPGGASLVAPNGIAVAADGSVYVAESTNQRIVKLTAAGQLSVVRSTDKYPTDVAILPGGRLAYVGIYNPSVDGPGEAVVCDENGGNPSTLTIPGGLLKPRGIVAAADGTIFISDTGHNRVMRVAPDGTAAPYAGNGATSEGDDDVLATNSGVYGPWGLALMPDGSLLIASHMGHRVRKVDPSGVIHTFAGGGTALIDGATATQAKIEAPMGLAVLDGQVYIAQGDALTNPLRIRRVSAEGRIVTVAGSGAPACGTDGGQALATPTQAPSDLAAYPDGSLLSVVPFCNKISRIAPPDLGFPSGNGFGVPSEDGSELYVFSGDSGRHLATVDTATTKTVLTFDYTPYTINGASVLLPTAVHELRGATNSVGRTMLINRDSAGSLTSFVASGAETTSAALTAEGMLWKLTRPAVIGQTTSYYEMDYPTAGSGLLETFFDPRRKEHRFEYATDSGKLVTDRDPFTLSGSAFKTLTRTPLASGKGYEVNVTTASGLASTYRVETLDNGDSLWRLTGPDNRTVERTTKPNESSTVDPSGATIVSTISPDPRFGTSATVPSTHLTLPSGKELIVERTRTAPGASPSGPLNFTSLTETVRVKQDAADEGLVYTTTLTAGPSPTVTVTTPEGRVLNATLDGYGRVTTIAPPLVSPISLWYDSYGRLTQVDQGQRRSKVGWRPASNDIDYLWAGTTNNVQKSLVDLNVNGRDELSSITRNDLKQIKFEYDSSSNLTRLNRPRGGVFVAHDFGYNDVDLLSVYDAPDVSGSTPGVTSYVLDTDRRLQSVTWPDTTGVSLEYFSNTDPEAGKLHYLKKLPSEGGAVLSTYAYHPQTTPPTPGNGRLSTVSTPQNVTTSLGWDGPALTSMQTIFPNAMSKTAGWTVGAYLRVTSETATGGSSANYVYDDDGLIIDTTARVGLDTYHLTTPRNQQTGWVASTMLRKISQTLVPHPTYGQLQTVTTLFNSANNVHTLSLQYDELGRVTNKSEVILTNFPAAASYLYDPAGRLQSENNGVTSWGYDDNGNRTTVDGNVIATYDLQDRVLTYNGTPYTHNANGDRTMKGTGLGATTYFYDSFHNLKSVTLPLTGGIVTYDIDGLGRRIGRHRTGLSPSDRYYLLGEGNRVLAEYDGSGTILSRFIYSTRSHVPDFMIKGTSVYRFITDQLGSVRLVVNVNATTAALSVVKQINYDAWGKITSESGTLDQPFGFAGGLHDRDTGLVHFGAREYDPVTGRWLQKDPIRFAGGDTNLYAYAGNDPVNRIDPTGLDWSAGWTLSLDAIAGDKGGVAGLNYQCFFSTDSPAGTSVECGWYGVRARRPEDAQGFAYGGTYQFNVAKGWGDWGGSFLNRAPSLGPCSGTAFTSTGNPGNSDPDLEGWTGAAFGPGIGAPIGLSESVTWYEPLDSKKAWADFLFGR